MAVKANTLVVHRVPLRGKLKEVAGHFKTHYDPNNLNAPRAFYIELWDGLKAVAIPASREELEELQAAIGLTLDTAAQVAAAAAADTTDGVTAIDEAAASA